MSLQGVPKLLQLFFLHSLDKSRHTVAEPMIGPVVCTGDVKLKALQLILNHLTFA